MSEQKIRDGGSAFPVPFPRHPTNTERGMSLRDWFAGQIMMGLVSSSKLVSPYEGRTMCETYAAMAYGAADAMLEARK